MGVTGGLIPVAVLGSTWELEKNEKQAAFLEPDPLLFLYL